MNIKLYIGSDLADFNEVFNVMFSVGDVRNSDGSNDKTYTLNLPLTSTNKRLLGFINEIDVRTEIDKTGRLYLNDMLIISGKIIITKYTEYFINIIITTDDWMDDLANLRLIDLDLSAYDFTFTKAKVEDSWSATYPMYRYPMINFGALTSGENGVSATWLPNDFIPMMVAIFSS